MATVAEINTAMATILAGADSGTTKANDLQAAKDAKEASDAELAAATVAAAKAIDEAKGARNLIISIMVCLQTVYTNGVYPLPDGAENTEATISNVLNLLVALKAAWQDVGDTAIAVITTTEALADATDDNTAKVDALAAANTALPIDLSGLWGDFQTVIDS